MKVFQQKIRICLKNLESLSYNVVDMDQLKEILRLTKQLEATVKDKAPADLDSGLTLRPSCKSTIIARKIINGMKYGKVTKILYASKTSQSWAAKISKTMHQSEICL